LTAVSGFFCRQAQEGGLGVRVLNSELTAEGMVQKIVGVGSQYLAVYSSTNGNTEK
jgi:hypothetical protein